MAAVVTVDGSLTCAHNGKPALTSTAKLTVGGKAVILYSKLSSFTPYTGCTYTNASGSNQPCAQTSAVSGGQAGKLTAGGEKVLLDDLQATTENSPPAPATVTVKAGQSKLTAA